MIDLGCIDSVREPAAYFAPFLSEGDCHRHERPRGWALIGHEAVSDAFADHDTLSADRISVLERVAADRDESFSLVVDLLRGWMIFRDPPAHTRLRTPVRSAFTHRRVSELTDVVEQVLDDAFGTMERLAVDGAGDLTQHVARPVPALVIGALLGVDPLDRPLLQHWSDDLAAVVFSLDPSHSPTESVVRAARAFHGFFGQLVDAVGDDDTLIARIAALGDDFDRTELIGLCTMLLFAGHETTTNLIQQMAAELLARPELVEHLRQPGADLELAVDEFMRVFGPARTMVRKVAADHERAGVEMRTGETVLLSIAAANHDARAFTDPGRFDPVRSPNPHLGFGWGLHHCLGAQLAKVEAVAFLRVLLRRLPELRSVGPPPEVVGSVLGFGRGPVLIAVDRSG